MRARRKYSWTIYVLSMAAAFLFAIADGRAQSLITHHTPIAIPVTTTLQVVRAFAPARPPAPASAVRPESSTLNPASVAAGCPTNTTQPAPLVAIVVALKCDPDLIFEYVYNNIEFEPRYGSSKGPLGTLLDRRGGDADQAILLVTLWNIAGYSQTGYINEGFELSGLQLSSLFGVQNDANATVADNALVQLLDAAGIPWCQTGSCQPTLNADNTIATIVILRFIAALQLNGTWYAFDPSAKLHTISNSLSGLASILGYSQHSFLSDAGGTITPGISIANINRSTLRADLTSYATNLVNYINQNNRTWSVGDVIGGKTIQPLLGSPIRIDATSTPSSTFPADCPNQTTTPECRTYITIQMGASASQAIKLYTDQIYGHRITVFSVPSGSMYVPTLLIDGAVPSCVGAGGCTNVGPAANAGSPWSIPVAVVEPNRPSSPSCPSGTVATACETLTVAAGGSYLISTGIGGVGRGMPEYHRRLLAQARAAGNLDNSEIVLGESLAVIGYTWLAQCSAEHAVGDQLAATTTLYYYGIGITGQANIQQSHYQGPYVDLPLNGVNVTPQSSTGPSTTIGAYSYPTALISAFFTHAETLSAFESAVLEQTQSSVSGMTAASTIKIIDDNMNASYSGALQTTFFADGTTSIGQATYNNTIKPAISSHYGASDLSAITGLVNGGAQVLIPENGLLGIGLWTGAGYTEISPQSNDAIGITQKITGGMSGGFSGVNIPDPTDNVQVTLPPPAATDTVDATLNPTPAPTNPIVAEPVDGVTGAYIYRHTDLVTGGSRFPYALPFSRTYLSSSGTFLNTTIADAGMGNGWAHNYSTNAQVQSDPYIGMGPWDSPAISAATSIVALFVMQDLLSATPTPQTMTVSSMVARWFTDQLTSNVVMVQQPNTTEEFVALPHGDGSTAYGFNSPPGSSAQFAQTAAGQYAYARKDGVTLNFGPTPAGALQGWVFPNGMAVNLSYSGSQLTTISNSLGRELYLTYNGADITSVTDDTGRNVAFGYDGNHNLTSFTDPLYATTTYAYDSSGIYDTFGHLTQIFYPFVPGNPFVTSWYDQLGRVIQQANANGYTSNLYFAGSRSEIVDAVGDRHVTYQTDRGKVTKEAYVLSSSFGDVFNDTPQQNGVVNVTINQYDGLDRLTLTTLPEGGTTAYTYATAVNPWANNIASVVRTAKPGSPLAPLTTSFLYDPVYNKPTEVIDPLGLVTVMSYDPATGNLLSTAADAGAGHFNATSRFTYNAVGQALTATDPLGVVTALAYDAFGNLTTQTADSGGSGHINAMTQFSYDALGDAVSRTDPNGNTATFAYDADRRLLITSAAAPNGAGSALVQTTNTYDPDGHLLSISRANGATPAVKRMSYTPTGQVQTVNDPNGHAMTNAYDVDDRLAQVTDQVGRITAYGYDALSRRISVSNPAIQATPLLQQSYTPDGLVASLTDANGNSTAFTPDGFDRLSTTTYPDSSTETYSYDADGNMLTRKTRAGTTLSFTYDTLNRLSTKSLPSEPTVSYVYDLDGRVISVSDNSASIPNPSASANYATNIAYDSLNRPLTTTWSPAPAQATPSAATTSFAFGYDTSNRRISQTTTDKTWWNYPATATSIGYTANNLNQYSTVGAVTPTYDGNGNLTYDGTFTYCYDAENHLISILTGGTCAAPTTTLATYAYDAQGRRKSKTVGSTTTMYVTDADNREVLEYNGTTGAVVNWYSFAPASAFGPDAVLNQMSVAPSTRATLISDIQGSIIGALDAASGTLTKAGYQTFGENTSLTSGSYQYTARRFDPETAGNGAQPSGLYYYRARMYSPTWGRFMQVDPIGSAGGSNLYAFSGNDPVNNIDLGGLWSFGGIVQGSAEAGLWPNFGVGSSGSVGNGTFYNPATGAVSQGQFASGGAIAQFNIYTVTAPSSTQQFNGVIGASAGLSQGYYFSPNANSLSDLLGPFQTYSLNTPWFSVQVGYGSGIWIFSAGVGPGVGASVSTYPTNTVPLSSTSSFQNTPTALASSIESFSYLGAETTNASGAVDGAPGPNSSSGSAPGK